MDKKLGKLTNVGKVGVWILKKFPKFFWKNVTSIGDYAFFKYYKKHQVNIEELLIPEGITSIGDYAFIDMKKLKKVTIPKTVQKIGVGAFSDCSNLKKLEIPEGVASVEGFLCAGCRSLEKVKLPKSVKRIKQGAFENCCSLKSIEIPQNVESINCLAFNNCTSLENVKLPVSAKFESTKYSDDCVFEDCQLLNDLNVIMPDGTSLTLKLRDDKMKLYSHKKLNQMLEDKLKEWNSKNLKEQSVNDETLAANLGQNEIIEYSEDVTIDDFDEFFELENYDEFIEGLPLFDDLDEFDTSFEPENFNSSSNNSEDEKQPS